MKDRSSTAGRGRALERTPEREPEREPVAGAPPAIRPLEERDWPSVRVIYEEGIETGRATFESEAPTWERWDESHRRDCRLVAEHAGRVVGWAALTPYSSRSVYAGVAEVSVYVAAASRGHGVGSALLEALIGCAEGTGIWTLQAGVFPQNDPSLALHQAAGFRVVGTRERIGRFAGGEWSDVVLLERRSPNVGLD
jgi:L-amino acid N-acyltransferase YncA